MTSTALVLLMIPGVGFFYSGLARRKSALSLIWLSMMATAVVSFQVGSGAMLKFSPHVSVWETVWLGGFSGSSGVILWLSRILVVDSLETWKISGLRDSLVIPLLEVRRFRTCCLLSIRECSLLLRMHFSCWKLLFFRLFIVGPGCLLIRGSL